MSGGTDSAGGGGCAGDGGAGIAMRPFEASLPMALLRAREATMRLFRPLLADHNLTEQQWRVLRALTTTAAAMEPTDLARQTFLLAPSLSRILANLEDRRLIIRSTPEHDQRRSRIELSGPGQQLVTKVAPWSEMTYNRIEHAFGRDRLDHLLAELKELAALFLEPHDGPSHDFDH